MAKPYYADYVNHILRFYFRYDSHKGFKNEVDKLNYIAADKVIKKQTDADIIILGKIFENCENINLHDNINSVAKELHLEATSIWSLVSGITTKIAKERWLL